MNPLDYYITAEPTDGPMNGRTREGWLAQVKERRTGAVVAAATRNDRVAAIDAARANFIKSRPIVGVAPEPIMGHGYE